MGALTNSYSHQTEKYFKFKLSLLKIDMMNVSQTENSSVNSQLRLMTEAYMAKHPGLTLNALALRCGVPATTMRRPHEKRWRERKE